MKDSFTRTQATMKDAEVKWMTLENIDASRTLKQHAYIPAIRKMRYTLEPYNGNKTLCSKSFATEDGETADSFDTLVGEVRNDDCCKNCLRIYEKGKEEHL